MSRTMWGLRKRFVHRIFRVPMADPTIQQDIVQSADFFAQYQGQVNWLLEPFAVDGSSIMLYGRQGSGKSTLAWQLAHALSTGSPWIGFPVARPIKMCYLNLDMPYKEFWRLMQRGSLDGFVPNGNIVVPDPKTFKGLNIRRPASKQYLKDLIEMHQIEGMVIDVISEAYIPSTGNVDINIEARGVVRGLQELVPNGVLIFLQHVRKGSPYKKTDEDDPDNFLGAGGWETIVTTSLKLTKDPDSGAAKLYPKKSRIDVAGFKELPLTLRPHGFFDAQHPYGEVLRSWPRLVPLGERFTPKSKTEVFEDVAKRCNTDADTVRSTFYRWRKNGTYFEWADALFTPDESV